MTADLPDRPPALTRRGPRPAPDETVDPVHFVPKMDEHTPAAGSASAQGPVQKTGRRKRELTFPFSTRLSQEVQEILDAAVEAEDITVRDAVEQAIRSRWGSKD